MKAKFIFISSALAGLTFFIISCMDNYKADAVAIAKELPAFPTYDVNLYGLDESLDESAEVDRVTSRHQNCCECQTSACSAKKCCSGTNGGNCSCTCTTTWYGTSSCNCGSCSSQTSSYEIWLTPEQFGVYSEFNDILTTDGSSAALLARGELLNTLDAISQNDFQGFYNSRVAMGSHLPNLSSATKKLVNNFLAKYNFEDARL